MSSAELPEQMIFERVQGVGTIDLRFESNKNLYCLIGENGVGKTRALEVIFELIFSEYSKVKDKKQVRSFDDVFIKDINSFDFNRPVVYLAAQQRGAIANEDVYPEVLGSFKERRKKYHENILDIIGHRKYLAYEGNIKNMSMLESASGWIVNRAHSANPYQSKEDNRQIELTTLLECLNKLSDNIDKSFLEITGDWQVFIKINGQKTKIEDLSSGYSSIFKMVQSIISAYGNMTNELNLRYVSGYVLIDEVESHLHNKWLVKILPLLKELFPNTTFIIATHSPIVLSQLEDGEAYRLERDSDGVVGTKKISHPNRAAFIDLLKEAFDIDLNQIKAQTSLNQSQLEVKSKLLDWLEGNK